MFPYPISFLGSSAAEAFSSTKSLNFDGVDDYVDTGITNTGTNDISVSCWIKTTETFVYTLSRCAFGGRSNVGGTNYTLGRLGSEWNSADDMVVRLNNTYGTTKLNDGDWHNIVYTYNFTTKEVKAYVDGNTTAEATITFAAWNTNYQIAIGWNGFDTSYYFQGNVDECAYFTRVLGASDITEIYNNGAPGDISGISDLEKWWRMGENSTFSSPQILMPEQNNKDKASNYSMAFDGVNDYIECGNDSSLMPTTALSISFWMEGVGSGDDFALRCGSTTLSNNYGYGFRVVSSTDYWFILGNGSTSSSLRISSPAPSTGWHHFLCTWDGTTQTMFIDGASVGTATFATTLAYDAGAFFIGGRSTTGSKNFEGNIDEVAIWNSDQSANIATIYNSGKPADLTSLSPTAWWRMGEEAIFNTSWLLPNKAQDVYSRYSLDFDGVDDQVATGNTPYATTPSISLWVKAPAQSAISNVIGGLGLLQYFGTNAAGADLMTYHWTVGWATIITDAFDDSWHHIVVTMDNSTGEIKAYKDGSLSTTVTIAGFIGVSTLLSNLGAYYGGTIRFYEGMLDEVSFYNTILDSTAVSTIYNSGVPSDLTGTSGLTNWWRMGEDATFSTNWTVPDKIGSNNGTSANMTIEDLVGEAPTTSGNGISDNMTIEDRTGDAPDSSNNALSYNMVEADIEEEAP